MFFSVTSDVCSCITSLSVLDTSLVMAGSVNVTAINNTALAFELALECMYIVQSPPSPLAPVTCIELIGGPKHRIVIGCANGILYLKDMSGKTLDSYNNNVGVSAMAYWNPDTAADLRDVTLSNEADTLPVKFITSHGVVVGLVNGSISQFVISDDDKFVPAWSVSDGGDHDSALSDICSICIARVTASTDIPESMPYVICGRGDGDVLLYGFERGLLQRSPAPRLVQTVKLQQSISR